MKYLGVDYLYILVEEKVVEYVFTYSGIECVLIFPHQRNNTVQLAISREFILKDMPKTKEDYEAYARTPCNEIEYDVIEIDFPFDYEIKDGDVILSDETSVKRYISEIGETIHQIQKSVMNIILSQTIADKRELNQILKADALSQYNYNEINGLLSIELLAETNSYVIRDNRGNDILSFNSPNHALRGFKLLCKWIVRYLKIIKSSQK